MRANQRGGDGQAEAGPTTIMLRGEKGLGQPRQMFRRNAAAFILYLQDDTSLLCVEARRQRDATRRVRQRLQRIDHQIHYHLLHLLGVATDRRYVGRETGVEPRRAPRDEMRE